MHFLVAFITIYWHKVCMSNTGKKMGRPRVDSAEVTSRLHRPLLNALEKWAKHNGVQRSEAIRILLAKALEVEKCAS